jgi:hypothetical protein
MVVVERAVRAVRRAAQALSSSRHVTFFQNWAVDSESAVKWQCLSSQTTTEPFCVYAEHCIYTQPSLCFSPHYDLNVQPIFPTMRRRGTLESRNTLDVSLDLANDIAGIRESVCKLR